MQAPKKPIRVAVIGCGGIASQVHCPNLSVIADFETVAYCDVDLARAEALRDRFGGAYVTSDAAAIFDDVAIDAVLIQTGERHHPALVQQAAIMGKHVFVEKPIATNMEDALATVFVLEETGVAFVFGTCNRLAPMVRRAKRMCPHPHYSYSQCSDTISAQACHNLDLAVNLFHEAPLSRVYASGGRFWGLDPHLPADSFATILTFADGSTHTSIQHGKAYNSLLRKYHFQLFGEEGCVYLAKRFKECHLLKTSDKPEQSWVFAGDDWDRGPHGYMGHHEELIEFANAIRGLEAPTVTARDAAYILAVEKAILASIERRAVVDFCAFLDELGAASLFTGRQSMARTA